MPDPQDTRRVEERFLRDPKGGLGAGRFIEPTDQNAGAGGATGPKEPIAWPRVATKRASLVERDNQDEYVTFHWNPSTYGITKEARWQEEAQDNGSSNLQWKGTELTKVRFTLFLNDIAQPFDRPRQYSCESTIQWLAERLRARTVARAARRAGLRFKVGQNWMNAPKFYEDTTAPPVLVLFGLSHPFECILKSISVETLQQSFGQLDDFKRFKRGEDRRERNAVGTSSTVRRAPTPSGFNEQAAFITRANVTIELVEYVNAPSAGETE